MVAAGIWGCRRGSISQGAAGSNESHAEQCSRALPASKESLDTLLLQVDSYGHPAVPQVDVAGRAPTRELPMTRGLSKSRILIHRQCARRLWLQVYKPELADESTDQPLTQVGTTVGVLARQVHPDGVLIDAEDLRAALRKTAQALTVRPRRPLFEATFEHDGVLVRADVLLPLARGWRMVEVKSSTSIKEYHLEDAAVQSWVLQGAGLPLHEQAIAHIDRDFVYPGDGQYHGLLIEQDVRTDVAEHMPEVPGWVAAARRTLAKRKEPDVAPGSQCDTPFPCPFQAHCIPEREGYPVDILPRGGKLAAQLKAEGYTDLRDVPASRLTGVLHRRVWQASTNGKPYLDPALGRIIRSLAYPRYFLDFETWAPAVPIWAGIRPYQQVPFQWSCHVQESNGRLRHEEFLAEDADDPRLPFANALMATLDTQGPILVWNQPFEQTRLSELAEAFPGLARRIRRIIDRLVDLLPLAREHYYHPDMLGSWSIKAVLPTIAPELDYAELEVADGTMAQQAFSRLLFENLADAERASIRQSLLTYCERDTLAMVKVAERFATSLTAHTTATSRGKRP